MFGALMVGVVAFTVSVTGLSLAVGLLPLFLLGLPVFTGTVAAVHWTVRPAAWLCDRMLDRPIAVRAMPRPTDPGFIAGPMSLVRRTDVWKEQAFALLYWVAATVAATVVSVLWGAALAGLLLPAYIAALPGDGVTWLHASLPAEAGLRHAAVGDDADRARR